MSRIGSWVPFALHRVFAVFPRGSIELRLTDNETIQAINRHVLGHDYPTDVISFGYSNQPPLLSGEMVVSVELAMDKAEELGWSAASELLLYVVHGTLHICGMDDQQAGDRAEMRSAEKQILTALGIAEIARFGADAESAGGRHE